MTNNPKTKKKTRRLYRKPEIEEVQLVAKEAVLTNCKTLTGAGPDQATCHPWGQCKNEGS